MKSTWKRWIGTAAVIGIAMTSIACKDSQKDKLQETYEQQQRKLKQAYKGARQTLKQRHQMAQQELKASQIQQAYAQARVDLRKRHTALKKQIETLANTIRTQDDNKTMAQALPKPIKTLRERCRLIGEKLSDSKPTMLSREELNAWRESIASQLSTLSQDIEKTKENIQSTD